MSISWNSVVTTVTNAECQRVAVAVVVHAPGITVTNARNAAHDNDGMAVDTQFLEQCSYNSHKRSKCSTWDGSSMPISWNNSGHKQFLSKRSATISIYYNGPSNLAIQIQNFYDSNPTIVNFIAKKRFTLSHNHT